MAEEEIIQVEVVLLEVHHLILPAQERVLVELEVRVVVDLQEQLVLSI